MRQEALPMRLINTVTAVLCSSALSLLLAACGVSSIGSGDGDGGTGGTAGAGGTGGAGGSSACAGPNPAGCHTQGCAPGEICADQGCASSSCDCDPATGGWICTDDCGGGTCVPDPSACGDPNPVGCHVQGCAQGEVCVDQGCTPSACVCDPASGSWACSEDCEGGSCVPDPSACDGPNPVGCHVQGCPDGEICVDEGCAPSACACDPATGTWVCDLDCGGGTCAPAP